MRLSSRHIVLFLAAALMLASCSGGKIIPKGKLTKIYVEMFLFDEWVRTQRGEMAKADTTLVYEPIFRKYGYTTEDYTRTVKKYLEEPEKFSKLFKKAQKICDDKLDRLEKKKEREALDAEAELEMQNEGK